jgi:hypothetical protein
VVSLETSIPALAEVGGAVFFELRHWKLKDELNLRKVSYEEGRHSVKAYSYINAKEIRHMACRLPIYKSSKPTDFRRRFKPAPLSLTQDLFSHLDVITGSKEDLVNNWGYIDPRPAMSSPNVISFFIDSLGLKDAHSRDLGEGSGYLNPRMMVTIVDSKGARIDKTYMTPEAREKKFQQIIFGHDLTVPLHVQDLYDLKAYFYFEFVHWKAHKGKDSVKCYSFMGVHEMRNGRFKLPIYRCEKPTNMTRQFKNMTQSGPDKDLWFRMEVFCDGFAEKPTGEVDYEPNETVEYGANETYAQEEDGVAYTGTDYYNQAPREEYGDYGDRYSNDAYNPDVDPEGLVQYTDSRDRRPVDI